MLMFGRKQQNSVKQLSSKLKKKSKNILKEKKKEYVVHIHSGIVLSHKKDWSNVICSNMDEHRDYHTK